MTKHEVNFQTHDDLEFRHSNEFMSLIEFLTLIPQSALQADVTKALISVYHNCLFIDKLSRNDNEIN